MIWLLACNEDPGDQGVDHLAPLGDVSLAEAQVRIDGASEESGLGWWAVAAGDVDGDGDADLALTDDVVGARVALLGDDEPVVVDTADDAVGVAIVDQVVAVGKRYSPPITDRRSAPTVPAVDLWSVDRVHVSPIATVSYASPPPWATNDYDPRSLGDVDGDGRDDLGVQLDVWAGDYPWVEAGAIWVLGRMDRDQELDADAVARLLGPTGWSYAGRSSAHGDLDGDGLAEQIVTLDQYYTGVDAVVASPPFAGDVLLDPAVLPSFSVGPCEVGSGGDLDGDGLDDVVLANGDAVVFSGPVSGANTAADAVATLRAHAFPELPIYAATIARDLDGDGFDDLLAGSPQDVGAEAGGVVAVWYGPVSGERDLAEADARLLGESPGDAAGSAVVGPGDTDGDEFGDVVVSAPYRAGGQGSVYVLAGGGEP